MNNNQNILDSAVFFIVGIMIFVLGLFIILNPAGIESWIGYIPIGLGFCLIINALFLFLRRELKI